jgi:hypothetical protein
MNPFDQAIRFQQLQATRRLHHCAIIPGAQPDSTVETERARQSMDNNVFSEFA